MNTERYIKEILKKVEVDRKTRRRLREDLTEAVEARLAAGESLKEIITAMGEPTAVAAEIQESYPNRRRTKPELALLAGTLAGSGWFVLNGIWLINQLLQRLALSALGWQGDMPQTGGGASIGIIGGSDGPTALFVTTRINMSAQLTPLVFSLLIAVVCGTLYLLMRKRKL